MSLEKNLHDVKEKLTKDQDLLVNAFRLESFYKKYKNIIFIILALVVLFGIYQGIAYYRDYTRQQNVERLINKLSSKNLNPNERKEIEQEIQQNNSDFYDFYRYTLLQNLSILEIKNPENIQELERLAHSKNAIIAALASYQYATFTEDIEKLENFKAQDLEILEDRAKFQAAYLYIQQGNIKKAHEILDGIQPNENNSYVYNMAMRLKHYGITQGMQQIKDNANNKEVSNKIDTTLEQTKKANKD